MAWYTCLMKHYVIIPTYNEKSNIRKIVEAILAAVPDVYILIVDDNSPDGTAGIVRDLQKNHKNIILRTRPRKLGLASAYTESIKYILEHDPGAFSITTMDADLSHDPNILKKMHLYIQHNDLVIGSRYVAGGGLENWTFDRKLLSIFGNVYARYVSGVQIHDLTAGYQCFKADLLRRKEFGELHTKGFAFQMEMKTIAYALGANILEIPIIFKNRVHGKSKISDSIIYEGLVIPWRLRRIMKQCKDQPTTIIRTGSVVHE